MTHYLRPRDLAEAVAARAAHPGYLVLAGGTDAMVKAPHREVPAGLIDLWRLPAIGGITVEGDQLRFGAGVTWHEVITAAAVRARLPMLVAAAQEIGAEQIQRRGTIGGNLANSSPVGDSLPVWLALDATLELASVRGVRTLPYAAFCTGYRQTALAADELIAAIRVTAPGPTVRQCWRKVGTRAAQSISKVMAAACITLDGDRVSAARIALGAVADRPVRVVSAETAVAGQPLTMAGALAATAVRAAIHPITDVRSTAGFRAQVASNIVARFFT